MISGQIGAAGQDGLSKVAHAVRRSTALYVAALVSAEGTTDEELLDRADRYAMWIRGHAESDRDQPEFLGKNPWSGSDSK